MKRNSVILLIVLSLLALPILLSGCVNGPSNPSTPTNPYLPNRASQQDRIEVSVNPFLIDGSQSFFFNKKTPLKNLENISTSLLSATVSCEEDAKYETIVSDNEMEYKMLFSDAWDGNPNSEGTMGSFFDFEVSKDSVVYLHGTGIKIIDGLNGNVAATVTTSIGSMTVTRMSSYINSLQVGNQTYSNVLKVRLLMSNSNLYGSGSSTLEFSYYFNKNTGMIKFDSYAIYDSQKILLIAVKLMNVNIGKYEIGPSPASSLSPKNTAVSGDVVLSWNSTETKVTYDVSLFNSNGILQKFSSLNLTTYDVGNLARDSYLWTVTSVGSNELSTISKPALFVVY